MCLPTPPGCLADIFNHHHNGDTGLQLCSAIGQWICAHVVAFYLIGMEWCGMAWYGVVTYGVAWHSMAFHGRGHDRLGPRR